MKIPATAYIDAPSVVIPSCASKTFFSNPMLCAEYGPAMFCDDIRKHVVQRVKRTLLPQGSQEEDHKVVRFVPKDHLSTFR